jgi:Alcohol dehydrogenase transcription factor Myb/SANT-like
MATNDAPVLMSDEENMSTAGSSDASLKRTSDYELIGLVKSLPVLWDTRLEEYKDAEMKNVKWAALAVDLNITPGNF